MLILKELHGAFLWEAGRKGTEEYNRQCRIMTEEVLSVVESLNEKYKSCEIMIKMLMPQETIWISQHFQRIAALYPDGMMVLTV